MNGLGRRRAPQVRVNYRGGGEEKSGGQWLWRMIFRDFSTRIAAVESVERGGTLLQLKGLDGLMPKFYLMLFEPAFQGHILVLGRKKTVAVGALAEELPANWGTRSN